jgi:hypothetical protein
MQISPSLHSYEKTPRSPVYDRKSVALEQSDDQAYSLRDDAMTGSQTVLSSSLAEALWSIQRTSSDDESMSGSAIESLYLSYAE